MAKPCTSIIMLVEDLIMHVSRKNSIPLKSSKIYCEKKCCVKNQKCHCRYRQSFVDMDELQFVLIVLFFLHLARNIKLFSIAILCRSTNLIQNCVRISLLPVAI
jgi:hypothetical protein